MIITLKTLQEDTFTVEIDPSETVQCLKEKIEKVKGQNFLAKNLKLMYAGKFLMDNKRICDYNLEEKKFVILVIKQPRRPMASVRGDPSPLEDAFMNGTDSSERDRMLRASHESLVQHIVDIGFTRTEVEQALRESYNNPDQAVDFLINNIVSNVSRRTSLLESPIVISTTSGPDYDVYDSHLIRQMTEDSPPVPSSSSILPSQQRIMQLFSEAITECERHTIAQNRAIEANRDRIVETYGELAAAGITDPHGLLSSLECSNEENTSENDNNTCGCCGSELAEPSAYGNLLQRDHAAIERLKQLGFDDEKAIEAYLVCDKNENAAADYLFTQND